MRKATLLILFAVCSIAVQAQSYEYLTFTTTSGEESLKSSGLTITFSDGSLIAANSEESKSFPLSSLTKFYFSDTAAAIESVAADIDDNGAVDVYNTSGQYVGRFSNTASAASGLCKGIYVIKGETTGKKLIVK